MLQQPRISPLLRRLIGQYLAFGVACVLCLAVVLHNSGFAAGKTLVPALLAVMLAGCVVLRGLFRPHDEIQSHLQDLATSGTESVNLTPVAGNTPEAVGWNRIVSGKANHSSLPELETRLNDAVREYRRQQFDSVLHGIPEGIAVADRDDRITSANRALCAQIGVEHDALIGQRLITRLPFAAEQQRSDVCRRLDSEAPVITFEVYAGDETDDGVLRIARCRRTDGGHHSGFVWTVRDITQQKLADEMRDRFLSSATHELRTPLTNIIAYAETLSLDDIDVEQQKAFVNTIHSEATRLSRFVDELLDINRMEAGSLTLDRSDIDLQRLISEVEAKVRPVIEQKQLHFEMILPPKLPKAHFDKDKFAAALINLVGNATKYTPEQGRVKLHVEMDDHEIHFHVEDSGIGISDDELPHIFDRFFRSDDSRVREISGSGLGLAFTRDVVRLHGGRLDVHSELNKGSRFSMVLPL